MVDLAARHDAVAAAVEERVVAVLRSGRWVGGRPVSEAEETVADWFGRRWAVGVGSGTDALMLALQAAGVGPKDEVLVPALTFFATAGAVAAIGAVPVVVDVREDGLLDPAAAAQQRGPATRAVIPVHLFGNLAEAPELGLTVIDDAAQAIGSQPPASTGALTAVSCYPTKTWGAAGDAGFVLGDDPELARTVRGLATHGQTSPGLHVDYAGVVGRVSRLDAIQAAVLLGHAPTVAARVARRRALAERYDRGLPPQVRPLPRQPGSAVHQYCVLVEQRERVVETLQHAGIGHAVYYPRPLSAQPALARFPRGPTPVAEHLCARLLALPVRASLSDEEVDTVLQVLERAVQ